MTQCPLHNIAMVEKNGQYGVYYSHMIPNVGYCNGKKITPFKVTPSNTNATSAEGFKQSLEPSISPINRPITREPINQVDSQIWADKDLRIARESALHSASRNHIGKQIDPDLMILEAEQYVKYIYNGLKSVEDIEEIDLPSERLLKEQEEIFETFRNPSSDTGS